MLVLFPPVEWFKLLAQLLLVYAPPAILAAYAYNKEREKKRNKKEWGQP